MGGKIMAVLLFMALIGISYYLINKKEKEKYQQKYMKRTGDENLKYYEDNNKAKRQEHVLKSIGFVDRTDTIEELESRWFTITRIILPIGLISSMFFPFLLGVLIIYLFVKFISIKCRIIYLKK